MTKLTAKKLLQKLEGEQNKIYTEVQLHVPCVGTETFTNISSNDLHTEIQNYLMDGGNSFSIVEFK